MGESLKTTTTEDGRVLAFAVWGDPDGFPIMSLHGTPGSRLNRWPNEDLYLELGVCVVTHDRAGYGRSTRRRGRTVADEARDVLLLADTLGFERFGVSGGSGGGPHMLACAALLPDRVIRATCAVGIAPLGSPGLERDAWLAGMDPENIKEFGWAEAGEDVLSVELEREHAAMVKRVAEDPSTILGSFDLSESDKTQLARPEVRQVIRESTPEQAVNGVWGWVDDDLAFLRPWGFDVRDISYPSSSSTARRMFWSRRRMEHGLPTTSRTASSRSTTRPVTWERIRNVRSRRTCVGSAMACPRAKSLGNAEPPAWIHQFSGLVELQNHVERLASNSQQPLRG